MIKAVCFDVGEVLIRLDPSRLISALGAKTESTPGETLHRLGQWPPYDQFERGGIDEPSFLVEAQKQWGTIAVGNDFATEFRAVWNSVLVEEIPGIDGILARLKVPAYGLSNSNPIHIAHCLENFPCLRRLKHLYTSYEVKARKPEQKAFDIMLQEIKMAPEAVLFFDDRLENVEAARALGMKAEWVRDAPADVEKYLKGYGLI